MASDVNPQRVALVRLVSAVGNISASCNTVVQFDLSPGSPERGEEQSKHQSGPKGIYDSQLTALRAA